MIKGYKASYNGKCMNDFLFEVGKTYEMYGEPLLCQYGFHFCEKPDDVMEFYLVQRNDFVLFEIIAHGDVDEGRAKSCTNKIEIVRVVPREEYNDIFDSKFDFSDGVHIKYSTGFECKFDENGRCIFKKIIDRSYI
jgi:hypothetical protein